MEFYGVICVCAECQRQHAIAIILQNLIQLNSAKLTCQVLEKKQESSSNN